MNEQTLTNGTDFVLLFHIALAIPIFSGQIRAIHKKSVKEFLQHKDDMKKFASFHLDVAKIFINTPKH